jgi:hypothetical protein
MSTRKNAAISPDHAASDPDPIADSTVSSSRSSRAKRRQEEVDTPDGNGAAAKVARLASAEEETKKQEGDETLETPLTTETIMNLLKDLWSDDKCVIQGALSKIADIGQRDASPHEKELKVRVLGGHTEVLHVIQKHGDCLEIQAEGMRALGNLSKLKETSKLLGEIGCVEVILAGMENYLDSETLQRYGCYVTGRLVSSMKGNMERVEKTGGIARVIAAMKAHPNCKKLQYHGCTVLLRMSRWEEYRPRILEAGGASAISTVMEKYREDPELRQRSFSAMKILATE